MTRTNLKNTPSFDFSKIADDIDFNIEPAEVYDIVLDSKHDDYENERSIGLIRFKRIRSDFYRSTKDLHFAAPLNSQVKSYPIKHEFVLIISAPTPQAGRVNQGVGYYYTDIVNVWQLINHNALPYSSFPITVKQESKSTEYTNFGGITNKKDDIELGDYFEEHIKRPNLTPYEGDTIMQGRWGNSIRFTSTSLKSKNPWSKSGTTGDPLIILRSDKRDNNKLYTVENINEDGSSIYIADGQLIGLEPAYTNLKSYTRPPDSPSIYKGNQVIINSGRLYFNAKQESVFISAADSISLASKGTINIDFKNSVTIGSKTKAEKTVLGETLVAVLNSIVIPSPMGPLTFNTSLLQPPVDGKAAWTAAYANDSLLSNKVHIE